MDLKIYEKTRYQNIFRHKKNKNLVISISNPKTSISKIDGKKIYEIEDALKIRNNPKIKMQKKSEIKYNGNFDEIWEKYIFYCKYMAKQAYNTYHKKEKIYNKHLKNKLNKRIGKISNKDIVNLIKNANTTDKQKNEILKVLRAFFHWYIGDEDFIKNPISNIKDYNVSKSKMKYWLPKNVQTFFSFMNQYINNNSMIPKKKEMAYRIKILVLLEFSLGDRIGETRALTFNSINKNNQNVGVYHSIEYDPNSEDFLGTTKTYWSQREIDISNKVIEEVEEYKNYLLNELGYPVCDDSLIFFNYSRNRPFSDKTLRDDFYYFSDLAGVPHIRLYDLRHTYVATMMAEGKELYLISERLGHTDFSTTVNKYGHLSNQVRKEIALTTDKYL